jgi:hypothetical protein
VHHATLVLGTDATIWAAFATAGATLLLALTTAGTALAAYRGLKGTRTQATVAQDALDQTRKHAVLAQHALEVAREQAAVAQEALDAQTQPFLTAHEDQNAHEVAGAEVGPRAGQDAARMRWRVRLVNGGHGSAVITEVRCVDAAGKQFGAPSVARRVLRAGEATHASVVAAADVRPDGGAYRFDIEYRDVSSKVSEARVRGAVRIEAAKQDRGNRGWVRRVAWADSLAGLDDPDLEEERDQPFWAVDPEVTVRRVVVP